VTLDTRLPTVAEHPDSVGLTLASNSVQLTDAVTGRVLTRYNNNTPLVYFAASQRQTRIVVGQGSDSFSVLTQLLWAT